jgi:hypothetical protein
MLSDLVCWHRTTGQRFQFEDFKKALEASMAPGRGPKSPKVFPESK